MWLIFQKVSWLQRLQIRPCLRLAVVAHQMNQIAVILFSSKVITVATLLVATVCHLTMRVVMLHYYDYLFLEKRQLQFTIPLEIFKKSGLKYRGKVNSGTTEGEAQFHSHWYKMSDQEKDAYQVLSYEEETHWNIKERNLQEDCNSLFRNYSTIKRLKGRSKTIFQYSTTMDIHQLQKTLLK